MRNFFETGEVGIRIGAFDLLPSVYLKEIYGSVVQSYRDGFSCEGRWIFCTGLELVSSLFGFVEGLVDKDGVPMLGIANRHPLLSLNLGCPGSNLAKARHRKWIPVRRRFTVVIGTYIFGSVDRRIT